ncbi:hypothetical protein L9F63_005827, partial [Diploptera punctata]
LFKLYFFPLKISFFFNFYPHINPLQALTAPTMRLHSSLFSAFLHHPHTPS